MLLIIDLQDACYSAACRGLTPQGKGAERWLSGLPDLSTGSLTMMGLWRWKCTMQATSALVAGWNMACRMFLQGQCRRWRESAHTAQDNTQEHQERHILQGAGAFAKSTLLQVTCLKTLIQLCKLFFAQSATTSDLQ